MTMVMFFKKLQPKQANELLDTIRTFFAKHPRRRVCHCLLFETIEFTARKGHEIEAVKEYAVKNWKPAQPKKATA